MDPTTFTEDSSRLSVTERHRLDQFKQILDDRRQIKHDDNTLLRFLRARNLHLEQAFRLYSAMIKWRSDVGADDVLKQLCFPEYPVVQKYYPRFYHKVDKLGRTV
ncbi:hypothetical protein HDV00_006986 [Rhizophlyctis rosea]|nr:hypothetical protein HDV00_006986 [Rhizophlyctis rosea]